MVIKVEFNFIHLERVLLDKAVNGIYQNGSSATVTTVGGSKYQVRVFPLIIAPGA